MSQLRRVQFCPHCSNSAPLRLEFVHFCEDTFPSANKVVDGAPGTFYLAICETCNQPLLFHRYYGLERDFAEPEPDPDLALSLLWPKDNAWTYELPESVRETYEEAYRIKNVAPNAFAVQIRRALESLCEDRGIKQGSLQMRLQELVSKGELPPVLAEMTDVLRAIGNIGAHASDRKVRHGQVSAIDEFFRAVVEYVYIAPNRIQSFKKQLVHLDSRS